MKHLRLSSSVNQALAPSVPPLQGPMPASWCPPSGATAPGAPQGWQWRHCGGFSLIETTVAAILVLAMATGVYAVMKPASAQAQAKQLNARLDSMQSAIQARYRNSPDFSDIGTLMAQPYCAPPGYTSQCPVPQGFFGNQPWGTLTLAAVAASPAKPLPGWTATLSAVPGPICAAVVGNEFDAWDSISVNGAPVTSKSQAIAACSQSAVSSVAFETTAGHLETAGDNRQNIHCALDWKHDPSCPQPGALPPVPPSFSTPAPITVTQPGTPATPCSNLSILSPAGQVYCPTAPVPMAPGTPPPSTPPTTPPPPPPPPSTPPACVPPPPQTQVVACPSGQISSVAPYGPDGITQRRTASCPYYYGDPVWGPWTTIGNTCTPSCTAPAPTANPPASRSFSCPSGQLISTSPYGSSAQQSATVSPTTYSCVSPSGPVVATPGTVNGPWTPAYACAPQCVAPAPSYNPPTSITTPCPSGQVTPAGAGSFTQTSPVSATTYSCSSPVGSVSASPGYATGPWSPAASSACAPRCVAPAPTPNASLSRTFSCPAGYLISTAPYPQSATQYESVSPTTYSCPAPTGPYSASPGVASGVWSPGYACAKQCVAPTPTTQTTTTTSGGPWSENGGRCAQNNAGQMYAILSCTTATISRSITYGCTSPVGSVTTAYSAWSPPSAPYTGCTVSRACPPACGTAGHPPCF